MENIANVKVDYNHILNAFKGNEVVENNLESIIKDFEYTHSMVSFDSKVMTNEEMVVTKASMLSTFICGIISAISVGSNFHSNLSLPENSELVKKQKSEEFAKKLSL